MVGCRLLTGRGNVPNITNNEKASEDDQKYLLAWKWDDAWTAALVSSALS